MKMKPRGKPFAKGHIVSLEMRRKISDSKRGVFVASIYSPERNRKISEAQVGRRFSLETRRKMSLRQLGKTQSQELIAKRVAARKGYRHSPETIAKMSATQRANGKPRKTDESKLWRRRMEYRVWRIAVYARDKYTCQFCGQVGGRLNPHHIRPFALFPALRFDVSNGITLCEPCHKTTPTYGCPAKRLNTKSIQV